MIIKTIKNDDSKMESKNMKHKQKLTKGGFKMKPIRFLIVAITMFGMVATASAITAAGTDITNQAIGNYDDANGNAMTQVQSLVVTTTVSQVAGVSQGGNQSQTIQSMTSTLYPVTVTNDGNGSDTFGLAATGAVVPAGGTYNIEIYHDVDGEGDIDAGTDLVVSSTTALAMAGTYDLLIKVTDVDGGAEGDVHTVTLTATAGYTVNGTVTDVITLVTTIQEATINGTTIIETGDETPAPGDAITFISCFDNDGTATAYNPIYRTVMPSNTTLNLSSVSIDGGSNFLTIATAAPYGDYHFRGDTLELFLADLDGAATICIQFDAIADAGLAAGDPIDFPANSPSFTYENLAGDPYTPEYPDETNFPAGGVDVAHTYGVALALLGTEGVDDVFVGDPGDTFEYAFTVTNGGNGSDNFDLSFASTYVTWVFYVDLNDDGILTQNEIDNLAVTETGSLLAAGVGNFIAVGTIPVGTGDTSVDATTFTATSQGGAAEAPPVVATGTDTAGTTCTAPTLTLLKSVTHGGTEYFNGDVNSAAPGVTLTYTIVVTNVGTGEATTVVVSDAIDLVNTAYVLDSMTIDGDGDPTVDDDDDADGAAYTGTDVVWSFPSMAAAAAHTLTFQVTVK